METLTQLSGRLQDRSAGKTSNDLKSPRSGGRGAGCAAAFWWDTRGKQEFHELSNAAVAREHCPAEGGVLRPSFSIENGVTHGNSQSCWVLSDVHVLFYSFGSFSLYTRLRHIRMSRAWCTAASIHVTSLFCSHMSLVKIHTLRDASPSLKLNR